MDQSTEKWHKWRDKGIGSSDAPVIMGHEEYLTKHQLCLEKMGVWKRPPGGFAAEFGHHFEPQARARLNLMHDLNMEPECVEHKDFPHLRASLDMADLKAGVFGEIKYMGQKNYDWCVENQKPLEKHFDQCQHQFMVTGFADAFYIPYTLTEDRKQIKDISFIPMKPDHAYISDKLFPAEEEFWKCVVNQTPPPLGKKDEKMIKDKMAVALANQYLKLKREIEEREEVLEAHRKALIELVDHPVVNFGGKLKVVRSVRKGNVDYASIPQLKDLDLEKFRKKASQTVTIKEIEK